MRPSSVPRRLATRPCVLLLAVLGALVLGSAPAVAATHSRHVVHHVVARHPKAHPKVHHVLRHHKAPATASSSGGTLAAQGVAAINDCQAHGQLTQNYSKTVLRKALAEMSATTKQYSDCQSIIQAALAHGIHPGSGSGGGGSSTGTIIIIVVIVVVLAAILVGGLAVRRRRHGGEAPTTGPGGTRLAGPPGPDGDEGDPGDGGEDPGSGDDPTQVRPPGP